MTDSAKPDYAEQAMAILRSNKPAGSPESNAQAREARRTQEAIARARTLVHADWVTVGDIRALSEPTKVREQLRDLCGDRSSAVRRYVYEHIRPYRTDVFKSTLEHFLGLGGGACLDPDRIALGISMCVERALASLRCCHVPYGGSSNHMLVCGLSPKLSDAHITVAGFTDNAPKTLCMFTRRPGGDDMEHRAPVEPTPEGIAAFVAPIVMEWVTAVEDAYEAVFEDARRSRTAYLQSLSGGD